MVTPPVSLQGALWWQRDPINHHGRSHGDRRADPSRRKLHPHGACEGRRRKARITAIMPVVLLLLQTLPSAAAVPTPATLRGGIVVNEVLIDPNSSTLNFDAAGDGR